MPGSSPVAEEKTPQHDQQYIDAFAAAAAAESGADVPAESDTTPAAESDAAADTAAPAPADDAGAADGAQSPDTPAAGDAGPSSDDGAAARAADPAQSATTEDIVKGLADLLRQQPPAGEAPAAAAAPEAPEQPPLYSATEIETLASYEKNWPDVAQAEALKRRAEYHDLLKVIFTEVIGYVQPLFDQQQVIGNTLHISELKQAVPDYSDQLEVEVGSWIDTQPAYLQNAYKQVMQRGTSDEVADLIGRYRAASGAAAPAATPSRASAPAPAKPAVTELSQAAKQAVASLAPVGSDRTQIPQGEDPMDFQSAFARYAAEMSG